ncbi:MAG: hypothetical protein LBU28_10180 [Spirochaetaceae bacterium]|jgi:hypothetical protein|nr:hypothetical protein [Spirochaetaceae bacterium]
MASKGKKLRFIIAGLAAFLVLAVLALGIWFAFFRPPVILVSDAFFDGIYGPWRTRIKQAETALRLFRPVKIVTIGENADSEMAALAVEETEDSPYGVLFPFRYVEGARRYARLHPEIPSVVLGGRLPTEAEVLYLPTDTAGDLYRAGRGAALLVPAGGGVYVFQDPRLTPEERRSFSEGLRDGGWEGEPEYVYGGTSLKDITGVSVLMSGAPPRFFEEAVRTAVILFSWIDPALTSQDVKVVFDDSPWALAVEAVQAMSGGETARSGDPAPLPARVSVLSRRIPDRMLQKELKKVLYNGTENSVNDIIDTAAGITVDFIDKAVDFITGKIEWIERGVKTLFRRLTKTP